MKSSKEKSVENPSEAKVVNEETLKNEEKSKRSMVQSTILVAGFFGIAIVISLAQYFLTARAFGVGAEQDAYVAAVQIPDTITKLLGGGAIGYAFIPLFSGFLARDERDKAWRLASHVVNTFFLASLLGSIFAFIFAPWLIGNVIAVGYPPETQGLSVNLMRLLLISAIIFSVSGLVMGMLHSHNHFLLPALAPILNDLGILGGILFLMPQFGIYGLVYGRIIGALLHLAIQIPGLIRYKARWYPELGFTLGLQQVKSFFRLLLPSGKNLQTIRKWLGYYLKGDLVSLGLPEDSVWRVVLLMLPRLIGLAVFNFNMILGTNLGSQLGEGAASAFDWGWRIMQMPETLIGSAMGIVIFPTLTALSAAEDVTGKRNAMAGALRYILIATIPSSIGLLLVGRTGLSLLEGGVFDASATNLVYAALSAFTLGLIVHSLLEIIARSFYADKDTLTPLWAALAGAGLNAGLALWLSGVYTTENPAVSNIGYVALANSIGTGLEVIILFYILRKRWQGLNEGSLAITTAKTLAASLVMGVVVFLVGQAFAMLGFEGRLMYTLAQLGLEVGLGLVTFLVVAWLLGLICS
jgi:putative peptidoglycan lipid II flippase